MISLYSGTPGSGKSLHVAERIYHRLKRKNKIIVGNFNINQENIKNVKSQYIYIDNADLTPEKLIWISNEYYEGLKPVEDEILLVIDECQLVFNARDWQKIGRNEWLSFFTQHRKLGYEVVLVAQFDLMIDKQIRSLIEYNYIHRKVSNFGIFGKIISSLALGKMFICVKVWYPLNEKVGSEFFTAHKRYYSIYDTYNLFNT